MAYAKLCHHMKEGEQVQDWDEKELLMELKRLLQERKNNKETEDWIQNNLNVKQRSSDELVRALMRAVCESVIVAGGGHKVDTRKMFWRMGLLKTYIRDEHKQLVALNVLQELMIHMEHPKNLMRMFFDVLLDEEVIQDEMFFNWESSADTKTLASVSGFFDWIRKVEQQLS
ncbi:unnamed protein product [Tetraodon nigroviridis]|uniref:(spotted green pufferfish) hypothetical protein n=1 Tax=Tetraodon nigroviridis TaxID=99883 RepID=Q4SI14_TETNG|nr:unnamed protein product [Tetraodon nigroviridis]